jgi:hypothetical protein
MLLGTLPPVNDYDQWIKTLEKERNRFEALHDKVRYLASHENLFSSITKKLL